jgi:hypothetical protein
MVARPHGVAVRHQPGRMIARLGVTPVAGSAGNTAGSRTGDLAEEPGLLPA